MNTTFIITGVLLLIAATACFIPRVRDRLRGFQYFANTVTLKSVNITPKGRATYQADNPFTARYLIAKIGTDYNHIDICTASDVPLGVVPDMTPSTDAASDTSYPLPVNLFGMNEDTERMIASGAITLGKYVIPDAAGQVKALPTSGGGATWIIGRAKTAALAAGDMLEVIPCFPIPTTIAP